MGLEAALALCTSKSEVADGEWGDAKGPPVKGIPVS